MTLKEFKNRLPGIIALGLITLLISLWILWATGEMYYEGWWGEWYNRLPYWGVGIILLVLAAIALRWPQIGGWILIIIGGGAFVWWMYLGKFSLNRLPIAFLLGGLAVLIGILFLLEAHNKKYLKAEERALSINWFKRCWRYIVVILFPLTVFIGATIFFAPLILNRVDDGNYGARLIEGNDVSLIWAPAGPGFWQGIKQSREVSELLPGDNPSWNDIAFYGKSPVGFKNKTILEGKNATEIDMQIMGLCNYLSEDGLSLMSEPQAIWRMPTTDEIVRSLISKGKNAKCAWDSQSTEADCQEQPNKDTPLWVPGNSPIYYWSANEFDSEEAWYVPYTGGGSYGGLIDHQPKTWGNSRHGFRCVREP